MVRVLIGNYLHFWKDINWVIIIYKVITRLQSTFLASLLNLAQHGFILNQAG